jgi:Domain of unknown function (DUF4440)
MHKRSRVPGCLTLAMFCMNAHAGDEETLRQITQELLDAIAPGHAEVWNRYLDEHVIHVDENGIVRTKAELLKELTPLPTGLKGSVHIDTFKAAIHGDTAVIAHEDQEQLDYFGQQLHSRFRSLDTWQRTNEGWRLVAEQTSAVLKDPPAVSLKQQDLCSYAGTYQLTENVRTVVSCAGDALTFARAERPGAKYLPEVRDVFFAPGQPRSRRIFQRDSQGNIIAFVDRREGEDVRWVRAPLQRRNSQLEH